MSFELTSNATQIIERFRGLSESTGGRVRDAIGRSLLVIQGKFLANPGVNLRGSRSGLASRLTSFSRIDASGDIEAAIGFRRTKNFPYELSQEFGATAKPGKAMVVPLSEKAKSMSARGLGPRDWPAGMLRIVKSMGRAFLVSTSRTRSTFEYILIKGLKPRMRFRETVRNSSDDVSNDIVTAWRQA